MRIMPRAPTAIMLACLGVLLTTSLASAHQPFFEDSDFTAAAPGRVKDPTVSTAIYATLDTRSDVDYVTFDGKRGQSVLVGITIPAIDGQESFTPTVAVLGRGLPTTELPPNLTAPQGAGAVVWTAPSGPANVFFEPFSRTSYWERQENRIELPADGRYTLAVWSDAGDVGRYTLVVGDREIMGGDPAFPIKLPGYWTAVEEPPTAPGSVPAAVPTPGTKPSCGRR